MAVLRILGLMAALALMVACNSRSPAPSSTPTSTPLASPTPTLSPLPPTATPARTLNLLSLTEPPHLDVQQTVSETLASMGPGIVYSRLLRVKSGPDVELPSMTVECDLCASWEQPQPTVFVFHLRSGVRWQNIPPVNGRALTASDVVQSLERQRTPGWPNALLLQAVDKLEAVDDRTVRVTLKYPDADFPLSLADGHSKIVAPEAVALKGDLKEGPTIGTGPWTLEGAETGVGYTFTRNEGYFETGLPRADALRIHFANDEATAYAAFVTGAVDVHRISLDQWGLLQRSSAKVERRLFPDPNSGLLMSLKANRPPLDNPDVRRAVLQALNPWSTLDSVWLSWGSVGVGVPAAQPGWPLAREEMGSYLNNPAKARELLAQAGAPNPLPLDLTVADFGERYVEYGRQVAKQLQEFGFATKTRTINPREYAEQVWGKGDYTVFLGPVPPVSTPNGFLFSILHSQGRWNISGYTDAILDKMIEEQAVEMDAQKRGEQVREIQRYVLDKGLLFMPVSFGRMWAWWPKVENFYPNFALSEYFFWARVGVK